MRPARVSASAVCCRSRSSSWPFRYASLPVSPSMRASASPIWRSSASARFSVSAFCAPTREWSSAESRAVRVILSSSLVAEITAAAPARSTRRAYDCCRVASVRLSATSFSSARSRSR